MPGGAKGRPGGPDRIVHARREQAHASQARSNRVGSGEREELDLLGAAD